MKTPFRLARRGLGSSPLPRIPGLVVTVVNIFLYRDRERRPQEALSLAHDKVAPFGPWQRETFPTPGPGTFFSIHTDVPSLQEPLPLWSYAWAFALHLEGPGLMSFFDKTGGGPAAFPACPEPGRRERSRETSPEADTAVLRSLLDALRSFPEGWATCTMGLDDQGKPKLIRGLDESHPA